MVPSLKICTVEPSLSATDSVTKVSVIAWAEEASSQTAAAMAVEWAVLNAVRYASPLGGLPKGLLSPEL